MADYPEMYNIELTGDPYSAKFIKKDVAQLPPDCVLPDELNSIPVLPVIDIVLPELECQFDLDTPIVPPPHFCTPSVDGSIVMKVCDSNPNMTITGSAGIIRKPDTECEYTLDGEFEFCMPCVPTFDVSIGIGTCSIDGKNSTRVDTITPFKFVYDEASCQYMLEGQVDICTPCIPTFQGTINFTTCEIPGKGNATVVENAVPVELVYDEDTCIYELRGDVKVCSPCVPTFESDFDINPPSGGNPAIAMSAPEFVFDEPSCTWKLKGNVNIECIPEYTADFQVNVEGPGSGVVSAAGFMGYRGSECQKELVGLLNIDVGCIVQNVQLGSIMGNNPISGQTQPTINMSVSGSGDGGCAQVVTIGADFTVPACTEMTLESSGEVEWSFPIKLGDEDVGQIEFTIRTFIDEGENECSKTIRLEATGYSAYLSFTKQELSICNGDGSTETIAVIAWPGSGGSSGE